MKATISILLLSFTILISCKSGNKQNRLSKASSPYLLEHADNPVDWYEWGDEALQKAKKENKPLLISIGYAACHWCHVMEKESFMDTAVARLMNENFINIKIDREERPDIDNIYMNACQLITGNGGWPLNAFAIPDGRPFFAGTYYTKQSWINLLKQISQAWIGKNKVIVAQAEALTKGIGEQELSFLNKEGEPVALITQYTTAFDSLIKNIDTLNGGLKGAPKFPMPAISEYLLQYHYFTGDPRASKAVHLTLRKMALGGIYDHVNGGFARYSTDTLWKVPHFEKMLYDNGQLMSLYAHAYQDRDYNWYHKLIYEIDGFITMDLTSPDGGFYSSVNADTEKGEGDYYTWTYDEFSKAFSSPAEAQTAIEYFNITKTGNWEKGKNILYATMDPIQFGISKGLNGQQSLDRIDDITIKLRKASTKSPKPSIDTKILTAWNAIMMIGYIDAYAAIGNDRFLAKAIRTAEFLQKNMLQDNGHLWRSYKDGKATIDGFLDDYAWLAKAYLRLYQATFDKQWLMLADKIARYAIEHFYDKNTGMFYYTASYASNLAVRKMEITDDVIPSSNATMAELLHKLGTYLENKDYLDKSNGMWFKIAGKIYPSTSYYAQWLYLAGLLSYGTSEVAIMGKDAISKNKDLQAAYLPDCLFIGATDKEDLPLLENKLVKDQTLIYVCTNKTCKLPVENITDALKRINQSKSSRTAKSK